MFSNFCNLNFNYFNAMKWFKKLQRKDHPGIFFPPPLLYVALFFIAPVLQRSIPISISFFETTIAAIAGMVCFLAGGVFMFPAVVQFKKAKTTLLTIKPVTHLQTSGVYKFTRNPMYLALLLFYVAFAFWFGNWWTLLLVPLLILMVNMLIIRREESYLERSFGATYLNYKHKVGRWL